MPNQLGSGAIIASIQNDLADNNAGLISAFDVRHNMEDIAFSINRIVASGDTATEFPFFHTVKISAEMATDATSVTATSGDMIVESGIFFPNAPINSTKRQNQPWLGPGEIEHGQLKAASLIAPNDDHTQYYHIDGRRALTGNMSTANNWVNASGADDTGLKFVVDSATDETQQTILVSGYTPSARASEAGFSNQGGFKFIDNSIIPNGKGMAKAWIHLNTSGTVSPYIDRPQVFASHNISAVERVDAGKFNIIFTSGTFSHNEYVAIGTANGTTTDASREDFEVNTVGIVVREGDDGTALRSCQVAIKDTAGVYQDSEQVDIVFYGWSPDEVSGVYPTVSRV
tara:strand:- start:4844 stop:5872 length:1029 start_codon:yes stop_codon:yes gene_type:complete